MATQIKAHITGTIWKIKVEVGQQVDEGDTLVIIESMKMEIPVSSPRAGRVVELKVAEGDPAKEGQVVAVIE